MAVVREFLNPTMSRSGLDPCLRRHGAGRLRDRKATDGTPEHSGLKAYKPRYIHIDVKYPPHMANETSRGYLFVAIDRASRWVFIGMYRHKAAATAQRFLGDLKRACPIRIRTILTGMARRSPTTFLACVGTLQHGSARLKRFAQLSVLIPGWPRQDRRKPTAWLSGSTALSRTYCKDNLLDLAISWGRRCTAMFGFITTRLHNQLWAAERPCKP